MSDPGAPLLRLEGVAKSFRRPDGAWHQAVRPTDLVVGPGETVALVGESGSGKSTLGRIALGLLAPDRGRVWLGGECLTGMAPARLRVARVAMQPIFQDPGASFNPRRTALALMSQALAHRGPEDLAGRAGRLLEGVGLRPAARYLARYPHELSGGQRQRLAIARALALEPRLIIADEPLSGVDVSLRGQILNLLADLRDELRVAYLMITHDISVARAFAHRVAVMQAGEIVETGPVALLDDPVHPYTRLLVAAVPALPDDRPAARTAI